MADLPNPPTCRRLPAGALVLTLVTLLAASCAVFGINSQVNLARNATILSGSISDDASGAGGTASATDPGAGPVVVVAYRRSFGRVQVGHYAVLDRPGSYELLVDNGDWLLCAFIDANRNLAFDIDERAANYGRPDTLPVRGGGIISDLDIDLPADTRGRVDFPVGLPVGDGRAAPFHSSLAGSLFSFDDPLFSLKTAEAGYFKPVDFFRDLGGSVYFLEPYDPGRVPVLFIHGAMGSPVNFRQLAAGLDPQRYQAWFYYYPSGAGLTAMSNLLGKKVEDLQRMYGFSQLHLVAHSMGGLVTRSYIMDFGARHPWLRSFQSICTPWDGVEDAANGVATSPFVLSSWRDIAKGSAFIANLYRSSLPNSLPFYLHFGFRGDRVPWKANNDGTITLQSQLDPRSQGEALGTFGYNENHTSILANRELARQVADIIGRYSGNGGGSRLELGIAGLSAGVLPSPFLAVVDHPDNAVAGESTAVALPIGAFRDGRAALSLPPGRSRIGVVAWGWRSLPSRLDVDIAPDAAVRADLRMEPVTILSLRVGIAGTGGRPDIGLLQPAGGVPPVSRIVVSGNGIERVVVPHAENRSFAEHYLDQADFFDEDRLVCFGLPPGTYRVTVEAPGSAPATVECRVDAGRPAPTAWVQLVPAPAR